MNRNLNRFFRDIRGATILEYGLVIFIIALAGVAALDVLGETLSDLLSIINE